MRSLLVASLLMALVALTPTPGAPGSANAETISIVASDNAFVKKEAPTQNFDEAQILKVQTFGELNASYLAYLRFDVSPLAGATITSASLDMFWSYAQSTNTVCVCALKDLATAGQTTETSWSGNLTWNTRPDGTGKLPGTLTSGKLASLSSSGNVGKVVSFNLTSALPGLLESDTNGQLTFLLYATADNRTEFASVANTTGKPVPTLNVGYEPIPEPGTLALLGMALLGLGWYAWRKRR